MDEIYKRRSIRKYTEDKVSDEILNEIIKAGMNAPSAGNEQPWHFVKITSREIHSRIMKIHPYSSMLNEAVTSILICGDPRLEKHKGFWVQDCSAATQNMLLAAVSFGLGSVWLGIYPINERVEGFRNIFSIPEEIIPFSLIPIGYPAESKKLKNEFLADRIHINKFK